MANPFAVHCKEIGDSANREEWLRVRSGYLGASDAAGILGIGKWASPYSIYQSRTTGLEVEVTERMKWGNRLERAILAGAAEELAAFDGRIIVPSGKLLASKSLPWAAATLDGLAIGTNGASWPVEAKNVDLWASEDWADGVPDYYVAQCQWQMMITGAPMVTAVALIGGNQFAWQDIPRDEPTIERLMLAGAMLWDGIQRRDPPPVDGHPATTKALAQLESDGSRVQLGNEATALTYNYAEADAEYKRASAAEKAAKEARDAIGNQIRLMLGSAEVGELYDGRVWQWKVEKRAGYTVAPSESRILRLKAAKKMKGAAE